MSQMDSEIQSNDIMDILYLVLLLVCSLSLIIISPKSRMILFWISLMLFFDPGGFFAGYFESNIFWRIKYYDFFFSLMLLVYLLKGLNKRHSGQDKVINKITKYLIMISLYFFLVFGILVPLSKGYIDLPFFLQKNRQFFYAIPLFIMTYHYSLNSIQMFYRIFIIFSTFILVSYFITLLTPLKIVPYYTISRYGEGDRITMISYGLIFWVLSMGLVFISMGYKLKIPLGKYLILSFGIMLITILLTLTKREFLRFIFMVLVIPFLVAKISSSQYLKKSTKFILPSIGILLILSIVFPKYIDLSVRLLNDTYQVLSTGEDSQGIEEYRVTGSGDLELVKDLIKENPFFGIGYYPVQWSDVMDMKEAGDKLGFALDASSEVPIYGALMRLGIIGLVIPFFLYIYLYKVWIRIFRFLRTNFQLLKLFPVELVILITLLYLLLTKVTIDAYMLFGDFYSPYSLTIFVVILGMVLAMMQRFRMVVSINKR